MLRQLTLRYIEISPWHCAHNHQYLLEFVLLVGDSIFDLCLTYIIDWCHKRLTLAPEDVMAQKHEDNERTLASGDQSLS
jgi:hypothetical protein